jgi:hypothetical protein
MSKGGRWYRKEEYKQPREPFELPDGSIVEIVREAYKGCPFALKITRVWTDERVSTIFLDPPREGLKPGTEYLFIDDPQPKHDTEEFEASLKNGTYRAPYLQLSSVPGNKPGDTHDSATDRHFETRAKFNEYYKQAKLEKVSPTDSMLHKTPQEQVQCNVSSYDVAKGPPVPREFEGAKFRSVSSHAQADAILRNS